MFDGFSGGKPRVLLATPKPAPGEDPPDIPGARLILGSEYDVETATDAWIRFGRPTGPGSVEAFQARALREYTAIICAERTLPRATYLLVEQALQRRTPAVRFYDYEAHKLYVVSRVARLAGDDYFAFGYLAG